MIKIKGIPASDGIAIGRTFCYTPAELTIPDCPTRTVEEELSRFISAKERASFELNHLYTIIEQRAGASEAAIFIAHQEMLADPALAGIVNSEINQGRSAEHAVAAATEKLAGMLAGMENELFAARAMDVRDVGRRILRILLGLPDTALDTVTEPVIILAKDLSPSDTAHLNPEMTLGFITEEGGLTSHSAILARTLGLPAIVGAGGGLLDRIPDGTLLVMDGRTGEIYIQPDEDTLEKYGALKTQRETLFKTLKEASGKAAATQDGRRVEVAANVGDLTSVHDAISHGAEGIGLLRTEFLYLDDSQPPGEEKQVKIYRRIFEAASGIPVIVRTLDIGGDKPPSYMTIPPELNPFLGWRAIRISIEEMIMFKTQVRAILRAAVGHQVRIMLPMISDLDELRRARELVEIVKYELELASVDYAKDVPVGIMVETPAAAMLVDILSEAADFFSLGTNDLTQYTMAVDRGNAKVSNLYQPLHPSVLRLIKQTIDAGHAQGKWVGMCGELAGMTKAIPILIGLGLDEFSMNPRAIPGAKHLIAKLTNQHAQEIAATAMTLRTAAEIEAYMEEILDSLK